jgi:hypothetical protein
MKKFLFLIPSLLALCCSSSLEDCICSAEFVIVRVRVTDENNSPVSGLITTVKDESGKIYDVSEYRLSEPGFYNVMNDSYVLNFSTFPKKIIFTGTSDSLEVSGIFFINTDECRCHVHKVTGPDSLAAIKK